MVRAKLVLMNRNIYCPSIQDLEDLKSCYDAYFSHHSLEYIGYIIPDSAMKKCVAWDISESKIDSVVETIKSREWLVVEPQVWVEQKITNQSSCNGSITYNTDVRMI